MTNSKQISVALAIFTTVATLALAEDAPQKPTAATDTKPASTNAPATSGTSIVSKAPAKQADVASKTAEFGTISKTNETYVTALDAHALDAAVKKTDKEGAFKGTVTKVFEPRGGVVAIVNFDADYKTALTALLQKENFDKFPALTNLTKKEVVVTGKFIDFQGRMEIVLTNAAQIKLVK